MNTSNSDKIIPNLNTFGSLKNGRNFSVGSGYRFGMNTQQKDDEIFVGAYTAEFWEYDSRLGRRWNLDPKPSHNKSNYGVFDNSPISKCDNLGDTTSYYTNSGTLLFTLNDKLTYTVTIVDDDKLNLFVFRIIAEAILPRTINTYASDLRVFGTSYDIRSFEKFYSENADPKKNPVKKLNGISIGNLYNVKLNSKPINFKKLFAETKCPLEEIEGIWSVEKGKEKTKNDLVYAELDQLYNNKPDIHLHPLNGSGQINYNIGKYISDQIDFSPGPSSLDKSSKNKSNVRDIAIDGNNIYIYNSSHTLTISKNKK